MCSEYDKEVEAIEVDMMVAPDHCWPVACFDVLRTTRLTHHIGGQTLLDDRAAHLECVQDCNQEVRGCRRRHGSLQVTADRWPAFQRVHMRGR